MCHMSPQLLHPQGSEIPRTEGGAALGGHRQFWGSEHLEFTYKVFSDREQGTHHTKTHPWDPNPAAELGPGRRRGQSSRAGTGVMTAVPGNPQRYRGTHSGTGEPTAVPGNPQRNRGAGRRRNEPGSTCTALQSPGSLWRTRDPPKEPGIPLQSPGSPCRAPDSPVEPGIPL